MSITLQEAKLPSLKDKIEKAAEAAKEAVKPKALIGAVKVEIKNRKRK